MVKLYKTTDRVSVKIDELEFKISPLTFEQKANIQSELISGDPIGIVKGARLAIKYSVKGVSGIVDANDQAYELAFENGELTDECVDDLLNVDQESKLSLVCTSLLNGIPKDIIDPQTNKKIKGVTIDPGKQKPPKK
jgi:hypothetical protein